MTKSNLFKAAHKMAKEIKNQYKEVDYKVQFGLCLSYLLQNKGEMIEMVQLIGSEKQIKWAEKIRIAKIEEASASKEKNEALVKKQGKLNKVTENFLTNIENFLARVETETSAKWYIENRDNRVISFDRW